MVAARRLEVGRLNVEEVFVPDVDERLANDWQAPPPRLSPFERLSTRPALSLLGALWL